MSAIPAASALLARSRHGMPKLAAGNSTAPTRNVIAADLMPVGSG